MKWEEHQEAHRREVALSVPDLNNNSSNKQTSKQQHKNLMDFPNAFTSKKVRNTRKKSLS